MSFLQKSFSKGKKGKNETVVYTIDEIHWLILENWFRHANIPDNDSLPKELGSLIIKHIPYIEIGYSDSDDLITVDKFDSKITVSGDNETHCVLKYPRLLGKESLPFKVSFDLSFPGKHSNGDDRISDVGRHGGIYFTTKMEKTDRWTDKEVVIIHWIDRRGDRGYNCYFKPGKNIWYHKQSLTQECGKHWQILFG